MGGKQIAVCLLALAASAGIFLRAHSQLHNTTRSATAKISAGRSSEKKLPGGISKNGRPRIRFAKTLKIEIVCAGERDWVPFRCR